MRIEVVESPRPLEEGIKESGDGTNEGEKKSAQKKKLKKDTPSNNGGNVISLADARAKKNKS